MEDVEEGRGSGGLEGDPLLRVRVRTPGLRSVILACAAVVTVVFITATTGEAMGGGARTVLAAEASWDPSNESWYVQYMDRPRGESYLNYAFRNNWLPAGWMVELSRDGTPIYINMANSSASTTPPVQPPYWMTQPTLGTQYANNPVWTYSDKEWRRFDQAVGIASAAAEHPSASDLGVGLAPAGSSPATRAAFWQYTHPVAPWGQRKAWYNTGGVLSPNSRGQVGAMLPRRHGDYYPFLDQFHALLKRDRAEKIMDDTEKNYASPPMPRFPIKLNEN